MDEPMEETCEADSTQPDVESNSVKKPVNNPLLRPGSMGEFRIRKSSNLSHCKLVYRILPKTNNFTLNNFSARKKKSHKPVILTWIPLPEA